MLAAADTYQSVTRPFIESLDPKSVAWVYNVLELKKERERLLYNDPDPEHGFLLNIDTKWQANRPFAVMAYLTSNFIPLCWAGNHTPIALRPMSKLGSMASGRTTTRFETCTALPFAIDETSGRFAT